MKYVKDMWIWAEHVDDAWKPARIIDVSEKSMKISFMNGKTAVIPSKGSWTILSIGSFNEDLQNADVCRDFSKMSSLSTESVLHFLRKSYYSNTYYSHLGAGTILAVNPFHSVKGLFSKEKIYAYHTASLFNLSKLPPHVFSVAEQALRDMANDMCLSNQSIIISGESGAGKTWTVRCLMRYLALVGMDASNSSLDFSNVGKDNEIRLSDSFVGDQIEHRILCSNPILEAFGNAATQRNYNSSRFGKFIQLQYDWCGNIVGAHLQVYLLEKTRVATQGKFDKPYHIFPQMLRGSNEAEKTEWLLDDIINFPKKHCHTTNNNNNCGMHESRSDSLDSLSEEDEVKNSDDVENMDGIYAFKKTRNAMLSVGISKAIQSEIFKLLSAILHLEKLSFEGDDDLSTPCVLTSYSQLNGKHAASLLSVPINSLLQAVTVREIQAGGLKARDRRRSIFMRSCTMDECSARRDGLMKYLYEQIFLWLVKHIGDDLSSNPNKACSFIGLLDVYGFESFEQNGLEQLCINFANEKLQQYYVNNFLKLQQEELAAEGITWKNMDTPKDKDGCLLTLEATHNSLFALLNEECRLNRPSNALQLKDRISEQFCRNSFVTVPRISTKSPCFAVVHYAGKVLYETGNLITKNKDELPIEIAHLLKNSKSEFIEQLISKRLKNVLSKQTGNRGKYHETLLTEFKKSLDDLLKTLSATNCHYIRCIKPNQRSLPRRFDSHYVADQLRSSGVVETVDICGRLHPHKFSYEQFISSYFFLLRDQHVSSSSNFNNLMNPYNQNQRTCIKILNAILGKNSHLQQVESWKFGKTSIFIASALFEILQIERSKEMNRCATRIQSCWLAHRKRQHCRKIRRQLIEERKAAVIVLQKAWKEKLLIRKNILEYRIKKIRRKNAARTIQTFWLSYIKRKRKLMKTEMEGLNMISHSIQVGPCASFHHASVRRLDLGLDLSSDNSFQENSFDWVSRPKHVLIERYFPSMVQMNFCRIACDFTRPIDIVAITFRSAIRSSLTVFSTRSSEIDSIYNGRSFLSISSLSDDPAAIPLRSFNLHDGSPVASSTPRRPSMLPFSNVLPKF